MRHGRTQNRTIDFAFKPVHRSLVNRTVFRNSGPMSRCLFFRASFRALLPAVFLCSSLTFAAEQASDSSQNATPVSEQQTTAPTPSQLEGKAPLVASELDSMSRILPPGSNVSLILKDRYGHSLFENRSDQLLAPASTLKILTGLAAYLYLGEDFRFRTQLLQSADGAAGIRFSGDPLFERKHLRRLLSQAKRAGLAEIRGDLILDGSAFNGHDSASGQAWDDQTTCFAAPASAISVNHNCVNGNVKRPVIGQLARPYVPDYEPIRFHSTAMVVDRQTQKDSHCAIELKRGPANLYTLTGCIVRSRYPMPLSLAVTDPVAYASELIAAEAAAIGLKISGQIRRGEMPADASVLAEHESQTLPLYLTRLLKESDNLIADVLLKTLGQRYYQQAGNYRNGTAAVREILADLASVDFANARISDGSGLSTYNLLNASILSQALDHITGMDNQLLREAMPISGVDGSLRFRKGIINSPLKGRIQAKSGYISGVHNLAGFIDTAAGERLQFVLMLSGISLTEAEKKRLRSVGGKGPVARFYESLFNRIYETALPEQHVASDDSGIAAEDSGIAAEDSGAITAQ